MLLADLVETPRLWTTGAAHRRVTWMELFFDLIFVAAVAQVGKPLAEDYSPAGLLRYAFLFVLIWWAWSGHTLFSTRFDTDDLVQRGLVLLQCFIAAVMAANASEALDSRSSAGFGAAYAAMRLILVAQYLRARRLPETRILTTRYAAGFGAAAVLWIVSALLEPPLRYWLWGAALAVDFSTPWLAGHHRRRFPPDAAHFPERFGLFTIILLGEFVASVMRGIESQEYWSFGAAATAFSGMAFAFVIRWWYFDVACAAKERHIRTRRQDLLFQIWHYAHLPLFLAIAVTGVGFERAISLEESDVLPYSEGWIFAAAAAFVMLTLAIVAAASEASSARCRTRRGLLAQSLPLLLALALAAVAPRLHRVLLAAGLLLLCTCQTLTARRAASSDKTH